MLGLKKLTQKRRSPRGALKVPVLIHLSGTQGKPLTGTLLDISDGGAHVFCQSTAFAPGQTMEIEILYGPEERFLSETSSLEGDPDAVSGPQVAEVRWINPKDKNAFGIQFTALSRSQRKFLVNLVRALVEHT